jgi:O-acetyl-ADP-ribose deacetylase (regulator of RNase III)
MAEPVKNFLPGRLKYVKGDCTIPESGGHRMIIQINNDLGVYGAGLSGAISKRWPIVAQEYRRWYRGQTNFKGGQVQEVTVQSDTSVVNMIAQHGIMSQASTDDPPIKYDQLAQCLDKVAAIAKENSSSIHTGRIGAGLAGGDWAIIEKMIVEKLINKGINVTIYDLPEVKQDEKQ